MNNNYVKIHHDMNIFGNIRKFHDNSHSPAHSICVLHDLCETHQYCVCRGPDVLIQFTSVFTNDDENLKYCTAHE